MIQSFNCYEIHTFVKLKVKILVEFFLEHEFAIESTVKINYVLSGYTNGIITH